MVIPNVARQFESSDARRAIPCFDEPNLKASFDFEIEIPEDLVALSNMPEKEVKKSKKDGHKIVSFERTPRMSTYLLAWAFGDFEYLEDHTRRKYVYWWLYPLEAVRATLPSAAWPARCDIQS